MKNLHKLVAVSLIGMSLQASGQEIQTEGRNKPFGVIRQNAPTRTAGSSAQKKMEQSRKVDFSEIDKKDLVHPYKDYVSCFGALQAPFAGNAVSDNAVGENKDIVLFTNPDHSGVEAQNEAYVVMTPDGLSQFSVPSSALEGIDPTEKGEQTGRIIELSVPNKLPILVMIKPGSPVSVTEVKPDAVSKDAAKLPISVSAMKLNKQASAEFEKRFKTELGDRIRNVDAAARKNLLAPVSSSKSDSNNDGLQKLADDTIKQWARSNDIAEKFGKLDDYRSSLKSCEGIQKKDKALYAEVLNELARINITEQAFNVVSTAAVENEHDLSKDANHQGGGRTSASVRATDSQRESKPANGGSVSK